MYVLAGDGALVTPISEYYDVAYGINICGDWVTISDGDAELNANGRIDYASYRETGVYQYGESVATVHPYAAELADVSLDLSSLLDVHGITPEQTASVVEALGPTGMITFTTALALWELTHRFDNALGAAGAP